VPSIALLKNHAAPKTRVPPEANPTNHWCRGYDYRRGSNDYGCRGNHGRPGYDHDRASIRTASSVRPAVETGAAATLRASAADGEE
jgi:hypothetical protein